jgi:effector-binding domain-containing protein
MKKILLSVSVVALMVSCGPSAEEKAAREKVMADSTAAANTADSLSKAEAAAAAAPKMYNGYEVKEIEWPENTYYGKRKTVSFKNYDFSKMTAFMGSTYPKVMEALEKNKIQPAMAPSSIIYKWDDEKQETDMAAVIAVPAGSEVKGFDKFTTPAGKVLHIAYYGSFDKSEPAHKAMDEYMKEKNMTVGEKIEEYVTDPGMEKDTTKWLTNIYYLVK